MHCQFAYQSRHILRALSLFIFCSLIPEWKWWHRILMAFILRSTVLFRCDTWIRRNFSASTSQNASIDSFIAIRAIVTWNNTLNTHWTHQMGEVQFDDKNTDFIARRKNTNKNIFEPNHLSMRFVGEWDVYNIGCKSDWRNDEWYAESMNISFAHRVFFSVFTTYDTIVCTFCSTDWSVIRSSEYKGDWYENEPK